MRNVKYSYSTIKDVNKLFPDSDEMKTAVKLGDMKLLDMVLDRVGFDVDEEDVLRAFRNKKEQKILQIAKRSKAIRDLYQKLFSEIESHMDDLSDKNDYNDCL